MASAASIEEMNRIRASLGIGPLPVPGDGPAVSEDSENWHAHQAEEKRKAERQARNEKIKKARDKEKRFEKLSGKGLADDDDTGDARSWVLGLDKRQKKVEKTRERTKRKDDEQRQREERDYTSKDLAGVRVGHELGDFDLEGGEQVLTLKDATIDEYEEEGDELENVDLRERERLKDQLDLKKKKPVYDPNATDEEGEGGFLHQYDEVIDGKKRKRFTIDVEGTAMDDRGSKRPTLNAASKLQSISLDVLQDVPISDYQEPKEASFKKSKTTKKKHKRQKEIDEDDEAPAKPNNGVNDGEDIMNVDTVQSVPTLKTTSPIFDDDDLQSALAKQRKEVLKKRKKITAQELARQLREESDAPESARDEDPEEPGLVLNETSEFVETIRPAEIEEQRRKAATKATEGVKTTESESGDEDTDMPNYADAVEEMPSKTDPDAEESKNQLTQTGLDNDTDLAPGLGSTLNLLRQRGLVEKTDTETQVARHRARQQFMADKRRELDFSELRARQQRERDRASGKLDRMSQHEREEYARWENKQRGQQDSRKLGDIFNKEYQPSFELKYVDDHGRHLKQKEAFKNLSHQFHGKGSGKQKTEKLLKKIEEEKKQASQSVLGAGQTTGLNNALGSTAKRTKQAGVRLA